MHNLVVDFEQDRAIAWRPGFVEDASTGELGFGGWTWRYDLTSYGADACRVTHTYDWSAVGPEPASAWSSHRSPTTTSRTRCTTWAT